ncbi:MAG: mechanosensitive ion channel [Xenococcaceae cyanobacterium MO_234.B1]|nr:mechanosensitive ion channel [Xenococcaceae cyanobacterium MO_234.B1]
MLILLVVCISSIIAIAYIGYTNGQQALKNSIFNQLISLKESKAYQIETYFQNIRAHIEVMSESPSVVNTMKELKQAYQELEEQPIQSQWNEKLKRYYEQEFLLKLAENVEEKPLLFSYMPSSSASRYLQYHYIANSPNPIEKKNFRQNPLDGSKYSSLHQQIQSIYRNFIVKFGYHNLFLVDTDTGNIVYTVKKEVDFATNLYEGSHSRSNLAEVVRAVQKGNAPGVVAITDFEPYHPSYAAPAAFIASSIFDGADLIGVLVFQISIDEINRVMTGDGNWQRDGLGKSGETYLVGSDYAMRSNSRFLVENKEDYLKMIETKKVSAKELDQIEKFNTSILYQKVNTTPVQKALAGETGTDIAKDYRGVITLSAYRPLDISELDWAIIAQIDRDEAFAPIRAFQHRVLFSTVIIVLLVTAIATIYSHYFVRPIHSLIDGFRKVGKGQTDVVVNVKAKDEFRELSNSFNEKVLGLQGDRQILQIVETLVGVCAIHALLSLVNALLFGEVKVGTWQAKIPKLFRDLVRFFLILVGTALVLSVVWKADLGGLITALGIGSIVIGLALQDTLGNLFSGITLLFERPFSLGDWLEINEIKGKVIEINWRSVHLLTRELELLVIPNGVLAKEVLRNYHLPQKLHIEPVDIGFSYDDPPNKVKQVLEETALATTGVLNKPKPEIQTIEYGDSSINYRVRLFLADYDKVPQIRDDFITRIWYAANRYNLNIPFPTRTLYSQPPTKSKPNEILARFVDYIRSFPSFVSIDQETLEQLAQDALFKHFGAGEPAINRGTKYTGLYLIIAGQALVSVQDSSGREIEIATLSRGEFFGEMALLTKSNLSSSLLVTAIEDLEVLMLKTEAVQLILDRVPRLAQEIGAVIETRRKAIQLALKSPNNTPVS